MEYNPFARQTQFNPYPVYEWMRNEAPLYHNAEVGFYALSRFDDVFEAFRNPQTYLSSHGVTIEGIDAGVDFLLTKDDPEHFWHRKLVSRVFTTRAIARLEAGIRDQTRKILDEAAGTMDIVDELAAVIPITVIGEMLGIPAELRRQLRSVTDRIIARPDPDSAAIPQEALVAVGEMITLLSQIVAERAGNPGDDIATLLLQAEVTDDDGRQWTLTAEQVAQRVYELVAAGYETTEKLVANGVVALAWYPDQRRRLADDPRLIPNAIEEMLRWDAPLHYVGRWVEKDVVKHDVTIPANSRVVLVIGSANHDERRFQNPELFDVHRHIDRHVAFGFGTHVCLGAALARLEARVVFEELLAQHSDYELSEPIVRAYGGNARGLASLPVLLKTGALAH